MTNSPDEAVNRHTGDPELVAIEKRLRKGTYLKDDERPLARILEDDAAEANRLGLDVEAAGRLLRRLYEEGRKGFGDPVIVDDEFEVSVREDRGFLACPFGDRYPGRKAIIYAKNLTNGRTITYSVLACHLIEAHGFFQGQGSPWRVEPKDVHEFMGDRTDDSEIG